MKNLTLKNVDCHLTLQLLSLISMNEKLIIKTIIRYEIKIVLTAIESRTFVEVPVMWRELCKIWRWSNVMMNTFFVADSFFCLILQFFVNYTTLNCLLFGTLLKNSLLIHLFNFFSSFCWRQNFTFLAFCTSHKYYN